MKRRHFLSRFGAAAVAPALPAIAAPSRATLGLATAHAKKYPFVSVVGLSRRVGVSLPEAEGLISTLSRRGILGPVQGAGRRPIHASSKVFVPHQGSMIKAAQAQKSRRAAQLRERYDLTAKSKAKPFDVDLSGLLTHVRTVCVDYGLTLHPRCFAGGAA